MLKLYVFVRSDLESMNPGKMAAQVAHAATQLAELVYTSTDCNVLFDNTVTTVAKKSVSDSILKEKYKEWIDQSGSFGTTIIINGGNQEDMETDVDDILDYHNPEYYGSGVVIDPTYPVKDGGVTHLINLTTCWWVFTESYVDGELYS